MLQLLDTPGFLDGKIGFDRQGIVRAMAGEHGLGGGFELGGLMGKVGTGAASGFTGIAGEFDAVDGEHLAADEPLAVTKKQDLGKQRGNLVAQGADEVGQGSKVRGAVTRQCNESNVFATGALNGARTDHAARVGEQHNLEQHARWISTGACEVVLIAGVESGEVDFVVDEVAQGVLEGAGQQLPFKINGNQARAGVDSLVTGHEGLSSRTSSSSLVIPFGSPQNVPMEKLFLQLR